MKIYSQADHKEALDCFSVLISRLSTGGLDTAAFAKWCYTSGFTAASSSTKWHGAYQGGLLDHSVNVANILQSITDKMGLQWEREISPVLVGITHDLCKFDEYVRTDGQPVVNLSGFTHSCHSCLYGHAEKSIMLASMFFTLTEEEVNAIRWHMGPYEGKDIWRPMEEAQKKFPNVIWTHQADLIATREEAKLEGL